MIDIIIQCILGAGLALIGWLGSRAFDAIEQRIKRLESESEDHYRHSKDFTLHDIDRERDAKKLQIMELNSNLLRHIDQDDKRFDKIEIKIDKMGESIEKILQSVARIEGNHNGR